MSGQSAGPKLRATRVLLYRTPRRSRTDSPSVPKNEGSSAQKYYETRTGVAHFVINIFLPRGMAHQETFDPKPYAPSEYRGPFDSIATAIKGERFGAHLPELAKIADTLKKTTDDFLSRYEQLSSARLVSSYMKPILALLGILLSLLAQSSCAAHQEKVTVVYQTLQDAPAVRQQLDIYPVKKTTNTKHPVLIWIHGGAWKFGSKEHSSPLKAKALNEAGIALVAVNYRFHPHVTYEDQAQDIANAIKWVQDNITQHGGDPNRIALMGHSAGTHLAALTSLDPKYLKTSQATSSAIKGVILLDGGGYDIPLRLETATGRLAQIYLDVFSTNKTKQISASPITYVNKGTHTPSFLIVPIARRSEVLTQARHFASALQRTGNSAQVHIATGKTHLSLNRQWGAKGDIPTDISLEFLKNVFSN